MSLPRRGFLGLLGAGWVASLDRRALAQAAQPLRFPPDLAGAELVAAPGTANVWPGVRTTVLTLGGGYPSPTIRVRRTERFAVRVANRLAEPTNVHWHGLVAPAEMDGHPADRVAAGAVREIAFPIVQRAGICWYHPHPDMETARQVYSGMAGFFLVSDDEEARLGLPGGERELPLLIQDRRRTADGSFRYAPSIMDLMSGYLGDTVLVNGTPDAALTIAATRYRLRVLNGSNARVFRLAFSDGRPLVVIGNDGGLLERAVSATAVDLAPGERLDVLVDFAGLAPGNSRTLRSLAFSTGMGMGMMGGGSQGAPFDILRFDVGRPGEASPPLPERLSEIERLDPAGAVRTRRFVFGHAMPPRPGGFWINGRAFAADRIDERVRLGDLEVWEFVNATTEPHPVHVHATSFQVLSRSGSALGPQDLGWKDTVLTWPGETVRVALRFSHYAGTFVLHCHNLEHEDAGMMSNVVVE